MYATLPTIEPLLQDSHWWAALGVVASSLGRTVVGHPQLFIQFVIITVPGNGQKQKAQDQAPFCSFFSSSFSRNIDRSASTVPSLEIRPPSLVCALLLRNNSDRLVPPAAWIPNRAVTESPW